jgi:glucosamine--fructose-6-phosphate aminotransferase (isomerizing)
LRDSLTQQAALAAAYLARAWPEAVEQARAALSPWRASVRRILLCGCGDSHCAARGAEYGVGLWSGLPVRAAEAMQASRYLLNDAGPELLVVGISSSGEVARTVEALEAARLSGARTLAITSSPASTLAGVADAVLGLRLPEFPFGPGLLSYLGAIQACLAIAWGFAPEPAAERLAARMGEIPERVESDRPAQTAAADAFADEVGAEAPGVVLGSGPCRGAAEFAAAKVMETCGLFYRAQDVEEWAHLEYFVESPPMPTWLLSADGRSRSREAEVEAAARAVGRRLLVTRWGGGKDWSREEREALAPLALWAGPAAFAQRLMMRRREVPFRDFGGGRNVAEGGGASRIRSSERGGWFTKG